MDIYVGNIHQEINEEHLNRLFSVFGEITNITLIKKDAEQPPKCFAFVQMPNSVDALRAVEELNGKELMGRMIRVSESNPNASAKETNRQERPRVNNEQLESDSYNPMRKQPKPKGPYYNELGQHNNGYGIDRPFTTFTIEDIGDGLIKVKFEDEKEFSVEEFTEDLKKELFESE